MADQTVLEQSLESQIVDEPFVSRQSVYVIDSNNGAYNGQIQIDTSSLSNSGRWASYSEGVLQIPLVVTLTALNSSTTAASTTTGTPKIAAGVGNQDLPGLIKQFAVGLKNGYYQLIHSLAVEYNNTSVVQLTPYLNHYVNYKLLTTLSEDDVEKWGSSIGFFPDSWESHDYDQLWTSAAGISASGKGSVNNKNLPNDGLNLRTNTDIIDTNYNKGAYKRTLRCTGSSPYGATTTAVVTEQNMKDLGRNYYKKASELGGTTASQYYDTFYVLAQIRLKDICDFFDKLPLTRGAYMRLLINTNTSEHRIGYGVKYSGTPASNFVNHINCYSSTIVGGSSPLMVASAEGTVSTFLDQRTQGGAFFSQKTTALSDGSTGTTGVSTTEYQFTARVSIVKDTTLNITHPTFQNCRLYVPLYTMTNEEVSRYLTLQPTKNIVYRDIFQYQIDVSAGGTFNSLLTNGVANPKALIVIPYIAASANKLQFLGDNLSGGTGGVATSSNPTAVWQSPFASEPGTTSPYVGIRDYNVQLAGVNIYTSNMLYDFEAFRNELARINGINGGVVDGLMSGLIGQENFQVNNRYYVTDLSRRIKAEDAVPKSIQISGTNASAVDITLFVFLEFERNVSVALDSGMLLG